MTHRAGESAAFQRQLSTGRIDPIRCHDPRNKHMAATPVIYSTKFFFQIRIFSEISIPQPPIFIGSVSTALPPVPPANLHECKASRLTYLAQHPSQHVVVTFVRTRPLTSSPPLLLLSPLCHPPYANSYANSNANRRVESLCGPRPSSIMGPPRRSISIGRYLIDSPPEGFKPWDL